MLPNEFTRREYNGKNSKNSCDPEPSEQSDPNPKKIFRIHNTELLRSFINVGHLCNTFSLKIH